MKKLLILYLAVNLFTFVTSNKKILNKILSVVKENQKLIKENYGYGNVNSEFVPSPPSSLGVTLFEVVNQLAGIGQPEARISGPRDGSEITLVIHYSPDATEPCGDVSFNVAYSKIQPILRLIHNTNGQLLCTALKMDVLIKNKIGCSKQISTFETRYVVAPNPTDPNKCIILSS